MKVNFYYLKYADYQRYSPEYIRYWFWFWDYFIEEMTDLRFEEGTGYYHEYYTQKFLEVHLLGCAIVVIWGKSKK